MNKREQLSKLLFWKKSKQFYADKLGISIEEVSELMEQLRTNSDTENLTSATQFIDSLFNIIEDKEKKTLQVSGTSATEIKDITEFVKQGNVDLTSWQVARYWQIFKAGKWHFSVNLKPKDDLKPDPQYIIDTLKELIPKPVMTLDMAPAIKGANNGKVLMVYVSDEHVGAYVGEEALYANDWSSAKYRGRKFKVLEAILRKVREQGKFTSIYICNLGDSLDSYNGYTTRGGHQLPTITSNKQSFSAYVETNIKFFDALVYANASESLHWICMTNANHDGDWGWAANKCLETYLNLKYQHISTTIMNKFIEHLKIGAHTFMICHGKDKLDRKNPLPFNLDNKTDVLIRDYMANHDINPSPIYTHFIKGDLHQANSVTARGFRYKNVPSLFGGTSWIGTNFGKTIPGFTLEVLDHTGTSLVEENIYIL